MLLYGASGHAKVIVDILNQMKSVKIIGVIDAVLPKGASFCDIPILGNDDMAKEILLKHPETQCFVAIGDNWIRNKVVEQIRSFQPSVKFVNAIHPRAIIAANVKLGEGICVMAGAVVNPFSEISDFVIVNTNSSIDHDCVLCQYCSIAPRAALGGGVVVNDYSAISIGASIKHGVKIGAHAVVGAGAVVLKNIEDNAVYYGVPAKFQRTRIKGERYL